MHRFPQRILTAFICLTLIGGLAACDDDSPVSSDARNDPRYLSGGKTTIFSNTTKAFSFPAPNLVGARLEQHLEGDANFELEFVSAPAPVNSGLGPLFNSNSCISCHPADGRGTTPHPGASPFSLLLRISQPGSNSDVPGGPRPVDGFGLQLQNQSLFGVQPEGRVHIDYAVEQGRFSDGETYELRRPTVRIEDTYIPLPGDVMISPRIAQPVFGRGLLEAIPEEDIRALADPFDADGDGISGRVNEVWDVEQQRVRMGRFGWKANQPSLRQQAAAAFNGDMGVTSDLFRLENSHGQPQSDGFGDDPEIDDELLESVVVYVQTLAVPARRNLDDPAVKRGKMLFNEARCEGCHTPALRTGAFPDSPELEFQDIQPFTDLLLHDMGEELADWRPDYLADGREWRTPPLWGLGLTRLIHGELRLLHDGRAHTLTEAIMWHGGEAEFSREYFAGLPKADRDAMLAYLGSM